VKLPALSRDGREWAVVAALASGVFLLLTLISARNGSVSGEFLVGVALTMALFALLALGLSLQFGLAGLINFGHIGFAAIGAYGVGLAHLNGWPWFAGVALGLLGAVALAIVVGIPTLRLREDYLAIATIGVAEIVRTIALSEVWLTRGPFGIYSFPLPGRDFATSGPWAALAASLGVVPYSPFFVAVLALVLFGVLYWTFSRLARSPWGRVLRAIREDEDVAGAVGKNPFRFKLQALALGAVPAALYGMLYAWAFAQIIPALFVPLVTFYAWTIVVVGGVTTLRGALAGSIAFWGLTAFARVLRLETIPVVGGPLESVVGFLTRPGPGQELLIGVLLVLVMLHRPQGIVGRREELRFGR